MGSIPQYQRDQFASTYVGGAQKDESNALVASAVQEGLVEPIRKNEIVKLKAREDAQTDLQANSAVVKYSLAVQTGLEDLQKAHASDPTKYTDAAQVYMRATTDKFAEGIGDDRVKTKFMAAAAGIQKQTIGPSLMWVKAQQEANATISVEETARDIALTAGKSTAPIALKQNLDALHDTIDNLAKGVTDPAFNKKMIDKYGPKAVEAHLFNRVMMNPQALINDLNAGEYEDIPEFTSALKAEYISKAETKIRSDQTAIRAAQIDNAQRLGLKVLAGTGTFAEIDAFETSEDPYTKITLTESKQLKSALVRQVKTETVDLATNNKAAKVYVDLLNNFVDDNIDRARFQQKLIGIWSDGTVDSSEATFLSTLKNNLTDMKVIKQRQDVNQVVGQTKAFITNLWRGNPKIPTENIVAKNLRNMIYDMTANGTSPNEAMKTVMSAALAEKLGITVSTSIPKDGKVYHTAKGVTFRVFRDTSPKGIVSYSYRRESP